MMLPTIKDATDRLRNLNLLRRHPISMFDGTGDFYHCALRIARILTGKFLRRPPHLNAHALCKFIAYEWMLVVKKMS